MNATKSSVYQNISKTPINPELRAFANLQQPESIVLSVVL